MNTKALRGLPMEPAPPSGHPGLRRDHMRRRMTMNFVGLGLLLALAVASSAGATPSTATADYQIGTFNMAGGNAEHGPKGNEAPDALVRSVNDRKPAFIVLQEACRDWSERLDSELGDYTVKFDPVQTHGSGPTAQCKHPSEFGNAILYRNDFGIDMDPVAHDLQSPENMEQREMLCVKSEAKRVAICSAHLSAGGKEEEVNARRAEAMVAMDILAVEYAGYTKFLGGDLNDDPLSAVTDNFYHSDYKRGAYGEFKGVDSPCGNDMKERTGFPQWVYCRSGEFTHDDWIWEEGRPGGLKIDFMFVSPSVDVRWGDATYAIHSDHDPLWASVTF